MSLPLKFDHCVVHVTSWDRSNRFYAEVLGAEIIHRSGRPVYRFGEIQLNLHGPGLRAEPLAKAPVLPGGSDLCFSWNGPIEDAVRHLHDKNIPIELGPVKRFGAGGEGTSVYFRDPDGSLLEFISYSA
jgi:catechol 2,3-dioxygenase-like lactoylglutathione lyase family enzyme